MSSKPIRVLVAGLGNMGRSHALAYHNNPGFEIVGLVNRSTPVLAPELADYTIHPDFETALNALKPDLCSINTYSDSHADYAVMAIRSRLRTSSSRSRWQRPLPMPNVSWQRRRPSRPEARRRLYPASSPVLDPADRGSAQARRALCLPHEPQPAVLRPDLG